MCGMILWRLFFPLFFSFFSSNAFEGRRNESGVFKRPKQSSAREESKAAAKSSTTTNNNRKEEINISDYNSSLLSFSLSLSLSLLSIYYCLD